MCIRDRYTGVETSVKNVSVAGLKSDLAGISTLTVQDPLLNIDGATSDKTCEIDLKDFLEPNITIAGMSDTVITVTLKVEPLREKTFTVNTKDIALNGKSCLLYTSGWGRERSICPTRCREARDRG